MDGSTEAATTPRFLCITGATTSGKTELSLGVAERLDGEIISMDSRQVYRGMDIGTDKVGAEGRARVPHHGLDRVDPDRRFSAGAWARQARERIAEIEARGRIPLIVGGTGFFLRALIQPMFQEPEMEAERRAALDDWLNRREAEELARWVRRLDPERAELAIEGGPQRMTRTLEVALLTGRPLSEWHRRAESEHEPLAGVICVVRVAREELDRRIDARVERMVERGLVDEVRGLLEEGYRRDDPGMSGTGYREFAEYLAGERSLEEAIAATQLATRQYARRQLTWFRNQLPDGVVTVDGTAPIGERIEAVITAWRRAVTEPGRGGGMSEREEEV